MGHINNRLVWGQPRVYSFSSCFMLLSKVNTYSVFLLGMSHIPYTHPTHVFNLGSLPSVSSCSIWPFLSHSFLPPCRAEALSLSSVGWWFVSHLLLPLLEQTLSTWLIYLGGTGGFFYSFRKGINVLYIHSTSKLWGKAWWNWVSGSKSQQSKFSGAGFVW